ncbi:serine proteinase stubble-like isoform X1 [Eurosta solidaginis]|uniref:serine proteinase stubble-like isoform X1 n=1 Tax=Eurosta solidaginis TaxID=178769 RepID=UPI003530D8F7
MRFVTTNLLFICVVLSVTFLSQYYTQAASVDSDDDEPRHLTNNQSSFFQSQSDSPFSKGYVMAKTSKRVGRVETNKVKQNNRLKAGGESSSLDSESDADSVSESRDADSEDDDDDDEDEYYNDSDDEESSSTDSSSDENIPRLLSQSAINRISETLGALNTMGHLLVDITRGGQHEPKPETYQASGVENEVNIATSTVSGMSTTSAITTTSTTMAAPSRKFSDVNPTAKILAPPSHESNLVNEQKMTNLKTLVKREGETQTPGNLMFVETKDTNKKKKKKKKNRNKVKKPATGAGSQTQQLEKLPTTMRPSTTTHPTTTHSIDRVDQLPATTEDVICKDAENYCKTPNGRPGRCEDLSSCPALLLNLSSLRESLCFKSLFVPGVCCPLPESSTMLTTQRPLKLTTKAPVTAIATKRPTTPHPASSPSLVLIPQLKPSTTTTTTTTTPNPLGNELELLGNNNIVDPEECGQQEYSSGRIVGGVEAPNGQWPWMAAIFLHGPKRTEFWCGGSLIGSNYILTAAHCTRDSRQKPFAARQFTVRLGDIDLSTDAEPSAPVTFAVKEVRAHERY